MLDNLIKTAAKLGDKLKQNNLKIVTAESCTGGEIAYVLTSVPGSSAWFERGFVTYSNEAKQELLRIPKCTLTDYGAVSEQTVIAMAKGAVAQSHGDIAVAVTGIAGPDGGTEEKPVGSVWISWSIYGKIMSKLYHFQGDRLDIRHQTVECALEYLLSEI